MIGVQGMPRRYYDYAQFPQFEPIQQFMNIGALMLTLGFLITLLNWIIGAAKGPKAGDNPWGSKSLEWTTVSPPPHGNWPTPPTVAADWTPYSYNRS
jgi:cytochrome c oxidase subunit 1